MPIIQEFKKFVVRGNFADMAIGFTVGAAFTTVVKSAVSDLFMPAVGLMTGGLDFTQQFWVLKAGENGERVFATMDAADKAGAITVNYGNFINNCFALLVVAMFMFMVLRMINRVDDAMEEEAGTKKVPDEPSHKKCPYCMATIAYQAVRCPQCTSELKGYADKVAAAAG